MPSPELPDLASLREEYAAQGLTDDAAGTDPLELFATWMREAHQAGLPEPNAMVLSTVSATGTVSARTVLLKGLESGALQFFTNLRSDKATDLAANPQCALLFPWHSLQRQVRITGIATLIPRADVEAYFALRPRASQLGAWASEQSSPIASRADLESQYAAAQQRFAAGEVSCPEHWGGYGVVPSVIEFWHGRVGRLHDRISFRRTSHGWERTRLQP